MHESYLFRVPEFYNKDARFECHAASGNMRDIVDHARNEREHRNIISAQSFSRKVISHAAQLFLAGHQEMHPKNNREVQAHLAANRSYDQILGVGEAQSNHSPSGRSSPAATVMPLPAGPQNREMPGFRPATPKTPTDTQATPLMPPPPRPPLRMLPRIRPSTPTTPTTSRAPTLMPPPSRPQQSVLSNLRPATSTSPAMTRPQELLSSPLAAGSSYSSRPESIPLSLLLTPAFPQLALTGFSHATTTTSACMQPARCPKPIVTHPHQTAAQTTIPSQLRPTPQQLPQGETSNPLANFPLPFQTQTTKPTQNHPTAPQQLSPGDISNPLDKLTHPIEPLSVYRGPCQPYHGLIVVMEEDQGLAQLVRFNRHPSHEEFQASTDREPGNLHIELVSLNTDGVTVVPLSRAATSKYGAHQVRRYDTLGGPGMVLNNRMAGVALADVFGVYTDARHSAMDQGRFHWVGEWSSFSKPDMMHARWP